MIQLCVLLLMNELATYNRSVSSRLRMINDAVRLATTKNSIIRYN